MRRAVCAATAALLVCSAHVSGQIYGWVQHELTWRELDAATGEPVANPNGVLEPGQVAEVSLSFSFWPPVGTQLPHPPWLEPGWTVHAMSEANIRLGGPPGTWGVHEMAQGWEGWILPAGPVSSRELLILLAQDAQGANQANPVESVWRSIWTPDSYEPDTAFFATYPHGTAVGWSWLWYEVDGNPPGEPYSAAPAHTFWGTLEIPVVPAPGSAGLLGGALALSLLRRRRRSREGLKC